MRGVLTTSGFSEIFFMKSVKICIVNSFIGFLRSTFFANQFHQKQKITKRTSIFFRWNTSFNDSCIAEKARGFHFGAC